MHFIYFHSDCIPFLRKALLMLVILGSKVVHIENWKSKGASLVNVLHNPL